MTNTQNTMNEASQNQNIIEEGGYILDADTGEILGLAGITEAFTVTDEKSADWVLEKMMDAEVEAARIRIKRDAITENLDKQIKEQERRRDYLAWKFGPALEHFAKEKLAGAKKKSIGLTFGTLAFRSVKGGVRVTDPAKALEWAKKFYPEAVKVTEAFQISLVPEGVKGEIDLVLKDPTAFAEGEPGHQEHYNELAREAFEVKPDSETFSIKTGVVGK